MRKLCCNLLAAVIIFITFSNLQAQKKGAAPAAGSSNAPSSSATASTPTASSSAAIESQMLAFGGLDDIASAVAFETCTRIYHDGASGNRTVVIFDQASFANIQAYQGFITNAASLKSLYYSLLQTNEYQGVKQCQSGAVKTRIDLFPDSEEAQAQRQRNARAQVEQEANRAAKCAEFEKQNPGQPCLVPHALGVSSTIDPFSDATSLLQAIAVSSNSESPGSIVIPDSAMAVAVTSQMHQRCGGVGQHLTVIYPPLFGKSSVSDLVPSDMQSVLQELHDVRSCVIQQLDTRNDNWVKATAPKCTTGTPTPAPATSDPITTPALADVNGMYDSFMNSLLQVNSSTGTVGSGAVEQGYQLATVLAGPMDEDKATPMYSHPAYILLASILSAGGTMRDHKTLWTALSSGDKITFSGGLIVNVALWQANSATPLYANILRYRVPFSDIADPTHPPAPAGSENHYSDATKGDNLPDVHPDAH